MIRTVRTAVSAVACVGAFGLGSLGLAGCNGAVPADTAKDEAAIRQIETDWAKDMATPARPASASTSSCNF